MPNDATAEKTGSAEHDDGTLVRGCHGSMFVTPIGGAAARVGLRGTCAAASDAGDRVPLPSARLD